MKKIIYLMPSIESHYCNFLPLLNNFENENLIFKMLYVKSIIAKNRDFNTNFNENKFIICLENREEALRFFKSKNEIIHSVLVGNDSEPEMVHILKYLKNKTKIILLQDGWLVEKNIKKPIYNHESIGNTIKKLIHRILVSKYSPLKYHFHNFIGQNSDYFFVYSTLAKKEFIKAKINSNTIYETGSPRFESFRSLELGLEPAVILFNTYVPGDLEKNTAMLVAIDSVVKFSRDTFGDKVKVVLKCHPKDNIIKYSKHTNITIHQGDIISLIAKYKPVFAFCYNSTVIFELMVQKIAFIQLIPPPFLKEDANYQLNLPYVENFESIHSKYLEALKFDYANIGKDLLLDIDPKHDSVSEILNVLNQL